MTTKNEHDTRQRESRIPTFATRDEEAAFWDTHDLSDYWDELQPVQLNVAKNLSRGITIRFDAETLRALRQHAHEKGIGPTTLARTWILERLQGITSSHAKEGK